MTRGDFGNEDDEQENADNERKAKACVWSFVFFFSFERPTSDRMFADASQKAKQPMGDDLLLAELNQSLNDVAFATNDVVGGKIQVWLLFVVRRSSFVVVLIERAARRSSNECGRQASVHRARLA